MKPLIKMLRDYYQDDFLTGTRTTKILFTIYWVCFIFGMALLPSAFLLNQLMIIPISALVLTIGFVFGQIALNIYEAGI